MTLILISTTAWYSLGFTIPWSAKLCKTSLDIIIILLIVWCAQWYLLPTTIPCLPISRPCKQFLLINCVISFIHVCLVLLQDEILSLLFLVPAVFNSLQIPAIWYLFIIYTLQNSIFIRILALLTKLNFLLSSRTFPLDYNLNIIIFPL